MASKARAFTFIIYPDSWKTWESDLEKLHIPIVVSPIHNRDIWTESDENENQEHVAGTLKKPHYHAIISWDGPVRPSVPLACLEQYGIKYVEAVNNYSAMSRYLCHLDNPEKAQYDIADCICLSGGMPDFERKLTNIEMMEQRDEIMALCEDNGIIEYADLCDFCRYHRPDWRQDVYMHTIFWRGYFASIRSRKSNR